MNEAEKWESQAPYLNLFARAALGYDVVVFLGLLRGSV